MSFKTKSNICGVTQGTTLGPLLFVLDILSPGSILQMENIWLIPLLIQLNSTYVESVAIKIDCTCALYKSLTP